MFDRCDDNTKEIIDAALIEARELGHNYLGTEHLLLAFSRRREFLPPTGAELLPGPEALLAQVLIDLGARTPTAPDADLLHAVGINLEEVRSAVRETFGDDVLEELGRRRAHQPWQPWRRSRRCTSVLAGTVSVAPRVKEALELALHRAEGAGRAIQPKDLLLGMIDVENGMSNRLLVTMGVDRGALRRSLGT